MWCVGCENNFDPLRYSKNIGITCSCGSGHFVCFECYKKYNNIKYWRDKFGLECNISLSDKSHEHNLSLKNVITNISPNNAGNNGMRYRQPAIQPAFKPKILR